jgi:adenosylcobinamide kinase/adenosylcobinamide-phosphate guanylyltransferase
VPEYPLGRVFRDVLGEANQLMATAADAVYSCVAGYAMM